MNITGREISLVLVFAAVAAATGSAQNTTTYARSCANGKEAIGFIGISGIDCNCTIGAPDADDWAFRTEPRITSLELDTRGGKILKTGDVITHVNGYLITTREGARALATIKPGQTVLLRVRRNGENLSFAIVADATCPDQVRLGIYAPTRPQGHAPKISGSTPHPMPKTGVVRGTTPPGAIYGVVGQVAPLPATPSRRGSFGFGLMCSGNCEIRAESDGALYFSEPPEIYNVERGSGADKAGLRRGDVITHVNGESITSKTGGRIFGLAKAGETVRFTIRRGGSSRTFSLTAAPPAASTMELAKSSESLERAQQSLRELQREQQRQMDRIQEEIRASRAAEADRVREMQREFYRQEQEHRRKLGELSNELARAETRMRAALADSSRNACAVASVAPRSGSRTLRYTGVVGGSEIEVRGPNPVTVTESGDEVTITAGSTQVKVKKHK
jgi:hypothetical protein